jgi:hypothetical protein
MSTPLDEQITSLIQAGEGGNVVSATKAVLTLLTSSSIAYEARLNPMLVGVHSQNRDGMGVLPSQVHKLLSDIVDLGFSEEVINAVCVESTPAEQSFNVNLMKNSGSALPPYSSADVIKYTSLGASHTNQALRCVIGQVSHSDDRLTINGKLNLEKVAMQDAALASACKSGIRWLVLPSTIITKHPGLAAMIQCGLNASGQIARLEGEVQVLRRLHACWLVEVDRSIDNNVEFKNIQTKVLRSKPPCGQYLHHMFNFLMRRCGGRSADLLTSTERFLASQMSEVKVVGAELFDVLASDVRGTVQQLNLVRHALLKYACVHGMVASEARRVLKDPEALVLEGLIAEINTTTSIVPVNANIIKVLGQFELNAISKLLGKRSDSIQLAAHDCIVEWNTLTGQSLVSRFQTECAEELASRLAKHQKAKESSSSSGSSVVLHTYKTSQFSFLCVRMVLG